MLLPRLPNSQWRLRFCTKFSSLSRTMMPSVFWETDVSASSAGTKFQSEYGPVAQVSWEKALKLVEFACAFQAFFQPQLQSQSPLITPLSAPTAWLRALSDKLNVSRGWKTPVVLLLIAQSSRSQRESNSLFITRPQQQHGLVYHHQQYMFELSQS